MRSPNKELERKGFGDLTTHDMADLWTYEPNQRELVPVLKLLFDLANDIQDDGSQGPRPRAVFILGGDVHTGSMHMISPDTVQNPHYGRNPHIFQLISSPISKHPSAEEIFVNAARHLQSGLDISKLDLVRSRGNFEQLANDLLGDNPAKFYLDDKRERHYATQIVDLLPDRNFGRIMVERVRPDRRVYHFYLSIEGQSRALSRAMELDLDAPSIEPTELFGRVLAAEGKVAFLRVHDVGTGWGPPQDHLDVETVIRLDSRPENAFGFQLRNDGNRPARQGMLDLLRDAFNHNWRVTIDYDIDEGKKNGRLFRAWLTK